VSEGGRPVMRWSRIVVGIIAVSLWAVTSYAQDVGDMGWHGRMPGGLLLPLIIKGVGLTDAQQTQVRGILAARRQTSQALFRQMREAREALVDALLTPGDVQAALPPLVQRVTQLQGQILQEGLNTMIEVQKVLSPEQLAKAAELHGRLRELRAEMRSLLTGEP
jgi:Spy/CpxP family protein refolding chaperone